MNWKCLSSRFVSSLLGSVVRAADNQPGTSLFDGKTFDGWEGNLKFFRIESGAVVGGSLKERIPHNEFLCTKTEYGDFELQLKFKLLGKGVNGGVQIRSRRIPNHHEVCGYQADMANAIGVACTTNPGGVGSWPAPPAAERGKIIHQEDWNQYVIRCQGRRIQLWVNGQQTVDYTETDASIHRRALSDSRSTAAGPSEAWYKDIVIRPLPETK